MAFEGLAGRDLGRDATQLGSWAEAGGYSSGAQPRA